MTTSSISLSYRTLFVTNLLDTPQRTHYIIKVPSVRGTDCVVDFMAQRLKVPTYRALRHDRSEVVDCHNLASARAIAEGRAPALTAEPVQTRVNVTAFVSPTGQYYVMHGNQRMDVANAQTARYYVKNGVDVNTLLTACLATLNQ